MIDLITQVHQDHAYLSDCDASLHLLLKILLNKLWHCHYTVPLTQKLIS